MFKLDLEKAEEPVWAAVHTTHIVVHSLSCVWLFATPWTAVCQVPLFIANSRSLLILMSIELVMPFNHLILCYPLLLFPSIFPIIRVLSKVSVLSIRWPKYWSFSFNISPPKGGIFRTDFRQDWPVWSPCSPRDSQESSPTPQVKSINSSVLSFLYRQLSHPYMTTGKTIALTRWT